MVIFSRFLRIAPALALVACEGAEAVDPFTESGVGAVGRPVLHDSPAPFADDPGAYQFFARAKHLDDNEVWGVDEFSEGAVKLDLKVMAWDGVGWTVCNGEEPCNTNEGRRTWGMPIYSPADGEITSCATNFDDNPAPGVKLDAVDEPGPEDDDTATIHGAGNHVWIKTTDGDMIALTHMLKGSIQPEVCPNDQDAIDVTVKNGSYKADLYLEPAVRPKIKRGAFIGLAGNSGNSGAPHLHLQYNEPGAAENEVDGGKPVKLKQVYGQPLNAGNAWDAWYPFRARTLTDEDGPTGVHAASMLRRSDTGGHAISEVEPVFVGESLAVTATRNGTGMLHVTTWNVKVDGITRIWDWYGDAASLVNVEKVDGDKVLVAYRTLEGQLQLLLLSVAGGGVEKLYTYTAGQVSAVDLTGYGDDTRFVTAVRNAAGQLQLIEWNVAMNTGDGSWEIRRNGDTVEERVLGVAVTAAKGFNGVAVAVQTAGERLRAIPFTISADGWDLSRGLDRTTVNPTTAEIDITALPRGFATASRNFEGRFELSTFAATSGGDLSGISASYIAGYVSQVDITSTPDAGNDLLTTVRDAAGDMLLMSWAMTESGENIRRGGADDAGPGSVLAAAPGSRVAGGGADRDMLLTAAADDVGDLELIYWDINLSD